MDGGDDSAPPLRQVSHAAHHIQRLKAVQPRRGLICLTSQVTCHSNKSVTTYHALATRHTMAVAAKVSLNAGQSCDTNKALKQDTVSRPCAALRRLSE